MITCGCGGVYRANRKQTLHIHERSKRHQQWLQQGSTAVAVASEDLPDLHLRQYASILKSSAEAAAQNAVEDPRLKVARWRLGRYLRDAAASAVPLKLTGQQLLMLLIDATLVGELPSNANGDAWRFVSRSLAVREEVLIAMADSITFNTTAIRFGLTGSLRFHPSVLGSDTTSSSAAATTND